MGVFLTSACISLAISELTRSIWRSLQGSPLLPSPSLAQHGPDRLGCHSLPPPSVSVRPQFGPHAGPCHYVIFNLDLSHITWHLPPSCCNLLSRWSKKALQRFSPSPARSHFCLLFYSPFPFIPSCSLTLFLSCFTRSVAHTHTHGFSLLVNSPAFPLWPLQIRPMCLCLAHMLQAEETRRGLDMGVYCQLCSIMHVSPTLTYELIDGDK